MLRATITKIKRACVITLVPRIVRGDGRYTIRKIGKSSINVLKKAGKSTDSGSKDGESECDKCKRLIELVFGPSKPKSNVQVFKGDNKAAISNINEVHKETAPQVQAKTKITTEKQNDILTDFFSADEDIVQRDNCNKNLKHQTEINEDKLTENRKKLDNDTLHTQRIIDMSQADYDHYSYQCGTEIGKTVNKASASHNFEHKRPNTNDPDIYITPEINYRLQGTPAKDNEDKLPKKIELLDEATHVTKAAPPAAEGFNITPKLLGNRCTNFEKCAKTDSKQNVQGSFDEIAKKCMDTPAGQIDDKVMHEIEKFGFSDKEEQNIVQTDQERKPEKPLHEVEIDLDTRKDRREPIRCTDEGKLAPSFEMPPHLDQGTVNEEDDIECISHDKIGMCQESKSFVERTDSIQYTKDIYDSRPKFDINQPIIDPYGKKALALDHDELAEALMNSKLLEEQRIGKPSEYKKSQEKSFGQTYVSSSEAIHSQDELTLPAKADDTTHLDQVQTVFDCAPREINWRPYPSFEAREEVMNFYFQDMHIDYTSLNNSHAIRQIRSESEPAVEEPDEPQIDHIYTSTAVSSEPREQISHGFVQPEEMINPLMDKNYNVPKAVNERTENIETNESESMEPLPSLNLDGNVPLTELLRRVRMRNRLEYCREFAIHTLNVQAPETLPEEGKCGKTKTPPCPPPPPKCPPPCPCPPKPACPPPPPPSNPCKPPSKRPCPPPKKNPCKKVTGTSIKEILTLLAQTNPRAKVLQKYLLPLLAYYNVNRSLGPTKIDEETVLNENFVFRFSILGKILLFHCTNPSDAILPRNRSELSFAKDYEPWTPIPSWPIPKKEEKKRFVCPNEGCKVPPPPKLHGPCKENPCLNFPKRSNFSLTDLCSFALIENLLRKTD